MFWHSHSNLSELAHKVRIQYIYFFQLIQKNQWSKGFVLSCPTWKVIQRSMASMANMFDSTTIAYLWVLGSSLELSQNLFGLVGNFFFLQFIHLKSTVNPTRYLLLTLSKEDFLIQVFNGIAHCQKSALPDILSTPLHHWIISKARITHTYRYLHYRKVSM